MEQINSFKVNHPKMKCGVFVADKYMIGNSYHNV